MICVASVSHQSKLCIFQSPTEKTKSLTEHTYAKIQNSTYVLVRSRRKETATLGTGTAKVPPKFRASEIHQLHGKTSALTYSTHENRSGAAGRIVRLLHWLQSYICDTQETKGGHSRVDQQQLDIACPTTYNSNVSCIRFQPMENQGSGKEDDKSVRNISRKTKGALSLHRK